MKLAPLNPVLARELKERMRSRRAGLIVTFYLGFLAVVLDILYNAASHNSSSFSGGPGALGSASLGRAMFETLVFFVLMLICFLVPGLTSGAIVGERERQTLIPLQVTLLRPSSIVAGKLLASLAFVGLLVVSTLPLLGVSFLLGGVTLGTVAKSVCMLLVTGVTLACLAMAASAVARRVQVATVLAYGMTLALLAGTFLVYGAEAILERSGSGRDPNRAVLILNPLVATADAVGRSRNQGQTSVLTALRSVLHRHDQGVVTVGPGGAAGFASSGNVGGFVQAVPIPPGVVVGPNGAISGPIGSGGFQAVPSTSRCCSLLNRAPFAVWSLAAFAIVSTLAFLLSVRRVRAPAGSDRA